MGNKSGGFIHHKGEGFISPAELETRNVETDKKSLKKFYDELKLIERAAKTELFSVYKKYKQEVMDIEEGPIYADYEAAKKALEDFSKPAELVTTDQRGHILKVLKIGAYLREKASRQALVRQAHLAQLERTRDAFKKTLDSEREKRLKKLFTHFNEALKRFSQIKVRLEFKSQKMKSLFFKHCQDYKKTPESLFDWDIYRQSQVKDREYMYDTNFSPAELLNKIYVTQNLVIEFIRKFNPDFTI